MNITVEEIPARIVGGPTVKGYAVICDKQIREWFRSKEEADRVADLFKGDASNPEDY
jgi:hypothetical protein